VSQSHPQGNATPCLLPGGTSIAGKIYPDFIPEEPEDFPSFIARREEIRSSNPTQIFFHKTGTNGLKGPEPWYRTQALSRETTPGQMTSPNPTNENSTEIPEIQVSEHGGARKDAGRPGKYGKQLRLYGSLGCPQFYTQRHNPASQDIIREDRGNAPQGSYRIDNSRRLRAHRQSGDRCLSPRNLPPSSAMASAPASRRTCSRTSTSIPSCACPTASLPLIPLFPPTCCFLTAPASPKKSGIMSNPCPKAGRPTPRPNPCNLKNLLTAWLGGQPAGKRPGLASQRGGLAAI
jgi:hypothetical protein